MAVLLLMSACTNDPSHGIASVATKSAASPSPSSDGAQLQEFAQCMTSHGATVTDPRNPTPPSGGPAAQAWPTAIESCRSLLSPEALGHTPDPAELEQLRTFAVCMRAHDIPITDPLPDGNMKINGRFERVTRTQLNADPVFIAAMDACRDKLPEADKSPSPKPQR